MYTNKNNKYTDLSHLKKFLAQRIRGQFWGKLLMISSVEEQAKLLIQIRSAPRWLPAIKVRLFVSYK